MWWILLWILPAIKIGLGAYASWKMAGFLNNLRIVVTQTGIGALCAVLLCVGILIRHLILPSYEFLYGKEAKYARKLTAFSFLAIVFGIAGISFRFYVETTTELKASILAMEIAVGNFFFVISATGIGLACAFLVVAGFAIRFVALPFYFEDARYIRWLSMFSFLAVLVGVSGVGLKYHTYSDKDAKLRARLAREVRLEEQNRVLAYRTAAQYGLLSTFVYYG